MLSKGFPWVTHASTTKLSEPNNSFVSQDGIVFWLVVGTI